MCGRFMPQLTCACGLDPILVLSIITGSAPQNLAGLFDDHSTSIVLVRVSTKLRDCKCLLGLHSILGEASSDHGTKVMVLSPALTVMIAESSRQIIIAHCR